MKKKNTLMKKKQSCSSRSLMVVNAQWHIHFLYSSSIIHFQPSFSTFREVLCPETVVVLHLTLEMIEQRYLQVALYIYLAIN